MPSTNFPRQKIRKDARYYAFEFSADESGKIWLGSQTQWVGWADNEYRVELREPSLVHADRLAKIWIDWKMPFHVVNSAEDFIRWFIYGGHALILESIAIELLAEQLKPDPCVKTGYLGFTSQRALPKTLFRRVPTPKLRMSVIRRDSYKCRICGRRSEHHVDIELNVHHIRPYGERGPTHEDNLITICDTCHRGLDPHFQWSLYNLIDDEEAKTDAAKIERLKYLQGVQAYRAARQTFLKELSGPQPEKRRDRAP